MEPAFGYINFDNSLSDEDLSKPPSSGIEYLRRVQKEASQCPTVVVAEVPKHMQTPVEQGAESVADRKFNENDRVPSLEAQERQVSMFAHLRQDFIRYKAQCRNMSLVKLPETQDIQMWCCFCFGEGFLKRCYKGRLTNERTFENLITTGHPPLLSILAQLGQPLAVKLLEYHLAWLDVCGFSVEQGRWLFGLMLCIDRPTPQDAMALLRSLARKCFALRRSYRMEADSQELINQLLLFVVIVSRYFEQGDLALS